MSGNSSSPADYNNCSSYNRSGGLVSNAWELQPGREILQLSYPSWEDPFGIWGHLNAPWLALFYTYVVVFGLAYFTLATVSAVVLFNRDIQGRAELRKLNKKTNVTLTCINVLLMIHGYSKLLYLLGDPYQITDYLTCSHCPIVWCLPRSLSWPNISGAFLLEFYTLWISVRVVRVSVAEHFGTVLFLLIFNYAVVITAQVTSYVSTEKGIVAIVACAIYFIIYCATLCVICLLTGRRIVNKIKKSARRSTSTFMYPQPSKHFRKVLSPLQVSAIIKVSIICYTTASLGLLLVAVSIGVLILLTQILFSDCISNVYTNRDLWLVLLYVEESIELSLGVVLLYCTMDFRLLWNKIKLAVCCSLKVYNGVRQS